MLNSRQIRFAHNVAEGKPDVDAYVDAGYSENGAAQGASRTLKDVEVQAEIEKWRETLAKLKGVDKNWVLAQWVAIATANPNGLVEIVREKCCRHCWGFEHQYQWQNIEEYAAAVAAGTLPDAGLGGFDYDPKRDSNLDCPQCRGGRTSMIVKNSKNHVLYNGAKQTKDGIEIKMRDRDGALENIANYLGMKVTKNELSGPGGSPLPLAGVTAKDFTEDQLAAMLDKLQVR
jgi:phage terminase small subunit